MDLFGLMEGQQEPQPSNPEQHDPFGVGTEEGSPEEQAALDRVMKGIEGAIHGRAGDKIASALEMAPDLISGISQVAAPLIQKADMELDGQGVQVPEDIWFAENGVIQQTVELVWEVAEAMGIPGSEDESQLEAAYMQTLAQVGDYLYENDPDSVIEAQEALMEAEMGPEAMQGVEAEAAAAMAPPMPEEEL